MKVPIAILVVAALLVVGRSAEAQGPGKPPEIKLVGARFIAEAKGPFETSWSTENPQRTGLAVTIEVTASSESSETRCAAFFLEYWLGGSGPLIEECIGLASSGDAKLTWMLGHGSAHRGSGSGPKTVSLLFSVSKDLKEFSVGYRHPAVVLKGTVAK